MHWRFPGSRQSWSGSRATMHDDVLDNSSVAMGRKLRPGNTPSAGEAQSAVFNSAPARIVDAIHD